MKMAAEKEISMVSVKVNESVKKLGIMLMET